MDVKQTTMAALFGEIVTPGDFHDQRMSMFTALRPSQRMPLEADLRSSRVAPARSRHRAHWRARRLASGTNRLQTLHRLMTLRLSAAESTLARLGAESPTRDAWRRGFSQLRRLHRQLQRANGLTQSGTSAEERRLAKRLLSLHAQRFQGLASRWIARRHDAPRAAIPPVVAALTLSEPLVAARPSAGSLRTAWRRVSAWLLHAHAELDFGPSR